VPAAGGQRERAAAKVPPGPGLVGVGARVEQNRQDGDAASAGDRMVQAALGVDVCAAVEEPAQPGRVLEVQLVQHHSLVAGLVEQVENGRVRLLAGVVEGVLIRGRAALNEQPNQRKVAALHRVEQRRHAPLTAPLDGVTVRVRARVEQQPGAIADVRWCADRSAQQDQQRRQRVHRRGRRYRVGVQKTCQGCGVGEHERPFDAVQAGGLDVVDQRSPAVEAVLAGDLVLGAAQPDGTVALAGLGLFAQVLQRWAWW
jgi:hypothetical protein